MTPHPASWMCLHLNKQVVEIWIQISHEETVPILVELGRIYDNNAGQLQAKSLKTENV